jgi:hypothetical protein
MLKRDGHEGPDCLARCKVEERKCTRKRQRVIILVFVIGVLALGRKDFVVRELKLPSFSKELDDFDSSIRKEMRFAQFLEVEACET